MRILKEPEERRNEILDAVEILFSTKGYARTTIIDILSAVDIAKGTFYYYFKSKEEVMDAMIDRIIKQDLVEAKEIACNTTLSPFEKIFHILLKQKPTKGSNKDKMIDQFQQPSNAEIQQRTITQCILHITPVLTEVVQQGINQGIFKTEYPQEVMEFLVVAGQTMFGTKVFQWTQEEKFQKIMSFISIMEILLGAEKGSFNRMVEVLMKNRA